MASKKEYADALLTQAYEKYSLDITKYCTVRLRENKSAVDDCVQEVFLVYYNRLLKGEDFEKVRAFLYRTADNICKSADTDFVRKAKRSVNLETVEEVAATPVDEKAASYDYDLLKEILLKELTPAEQQLYKLKYVDRLSLKEIGDLLNIPPNAVANRTSRLRTKIKDLISPIIEQNTEGGVML